MSKRTKPADNTPALINQAQPASIVNPAPEQNNPAPELATTTPERATPVPPENIAAPEQNNPAPEKPEIVLPKATPRALKKLKLQHKGK